MYLFLQLNSYSKIHIKTSRLNFHSIYQYTDTHGIPLIFKKEVIILNPKVEKGGDTIHQQNKAVFYFHFDIFIFENKVAGEKNAI